LQKKIIVIKLGGSALTDKSRIYTPRFAAIHRAAEQICALQSLVSVVLVHGAGSYGHIPAKQFGLQHDFKNSSQLNGLCLTKSKLLEWERIIDDVLLKHRVRFVPFVASDFMETKNGRIIGAELGPLKRWLRLGCVPTLGGDIVPDANRGFSILSGDQIATYLATRLEASRLIFGLDVDGVFDVNPKLFSEARLLPELLPKAALELACKSSRKTTPDVTGEMAGKIREAVAAARRGIPVYFVNLNRRDRLRKVALGRQVPCSRIVPQKGSQ
jgi:isopentenyl phosphate kinase